MDEEFDIYEDLHLDAILVATVGEDGTVTPVEAAGTELTEIYCHHMSDSKSGKFTVRIGPI